MITMLQMNFTGSISVTSSCLVDFKYGRKSRCAAAVGWFLKTWKRLRTV